ncbi:MAG: PocR ligand-binding domain-containing protein, partial [Deltaproteobacteria bacterium]|nr:PocR ligand-binding domain-containing protein [Deltaproteobacteria bacterium]
MPNPSPSFREIVNLEELQKLFTTFSAATGYPTGLVECASGEVLFGTGWRELCANFHRQNPASKEQCHAGNLKIEHGLEKPGDIRINRCPHGLVHGCTPIIVNGYRLANIFTGQVLFAPPDIDHFKKQARQFSYDEAAYLEALAETPVVSEEKFSAMLGFLAQMATMIARSGLANLRLQE